MTILLNKETYIGNGVYVRFDGYQIWLRTLRENGYHEVALEPEVYEALTNYIRDLLNQVKAMRQA